jgi:hypothetical protein
MKQGGGVRNHDVSIGEQGSEVDDEGGGDDALVRESSAGYWMVVPVDDDDAFRAVLDDQDAVVVVDAEKTLHRARLGVALAVVVSVVHQYPIIFRFGSGQS